MFHAASGMGHGSRETVLNGGPAADVAETDPHQGKKFGNNQKELQDFIVNRARETTEKNVTEDNGGAQKNTEMKNPSMGNQAVEQAQGLNQQSHGIKADA